MSSSSNIEWTDATWNPTVGCTKVSEGCRNCYAMQMAQRIAAAGEWAAAQGKEKTAVQAAYAAVVARDLKGSPLPQWNNEVRTIKERLTEPLRWKTPRRVFVDSMSDLFHEGVPFDFIDQVFAVMALTPQHTYQVLTKRPDRMAEYLSIASAALVNRLHGVTSGWPLHNVWLGTSIEDRPPRILHLLRCQGVVRFVSIEPLLGRVDLSDHFGRWLCDYCGTSYAEYVNGCPRCHFGEPGTSTSVRLSRIHWVILGCESRGGQAGRFADEYAAAARDIIDQCRAAGVPLFHKQMPIGGRVSKKMSEWPEEFRLREWP